MKHYTRIHILFLLQIFFLFQVNGQQVYGVAYSPYRRYGHCPTLQEITQDNSIRIQHTGRVRLYSTECHVLNEMMLSAASIPSHGQQLELLLGVWIDRDPQRNNKEIQDLYLFLRRFPSARLSGIVVGNEVLYRKAMDAGSLAAKVTEVKNMVRQIGAETGSGILQTVPVFSVDVFPHPTVVAVSDAVGVNVHPFYRRDIPQLQDPNQMAQLAFSKSVEQIEHLQRLFGGKEIYVTETGWPSNSAQHEPHRGNLQVSKLYLQKFAAWAVTQQLKYWWFQLFDSVWKRSQLPNEPPSHSEFNWGLHDSGRQKKF